jgi:hypothetical protein
MVSGLSTHATLISNVYKHYRELSVDRILCLPIWYCLNLLSSKPLQRINSWMRVINSEDGEPPNKVPHHGVGYFIWLSAQ